MKLENNILKKIFYFNLFLVIYFIMFKVVKIQVADNNINDNLSAESNLGKNIESWANSMIETLQIVSSKSYYPMVFDDSMIKALDAFVKKDTHSRFLGPKEYNDLIKSTKGEFYGIGVILGPKTPDDEFLTILQVIDDSPAYKQGLQKFDKIVAINNHPINNLTVDEAVKLLKAEKRYSPVNLTILRDSKIVLNITVKRDIVKESNIVCYYFKNQNVAYLALSMFCEKSCADLSNYLKKINSKKPKGLILDLRNNPGGILGSAVNCASLFLGKDKLIVYTKDKNQNIQEQLYTSSDKIINNMPIIILINNFTASAAEILAGALRAHSSNNIIKISNRNTNLNNVNPHAFILGTTSYGKGSVQEVIPISNVCALKLTTSLYYLPDNSSIDCKGIEPDFWVDQRYPPSSEVRLLNKIYGKECHNSCERVKLEPEIKEQDYYKKKIEFIKNDSQIQAAANLILLLNLGVRKHKNLNNRANAFKFLKHNFICDQLTLEQIS